MPDRVNGRGRTLREHLEPGPDATMADATLDQSNISFGTRLGNRTPQFQPNTYADVDEDEEVDDDDDDDVDQEEIDPGALTHRHRRTCAELMNPTR